MDSSVFHIIGYIALASILLYLFLSVYLFNFAHLNFRKQPFSHLGGISKTMVLFNLSLFTLGVAQTLFIIAIAVKFDVFKSTLGILGMAFLLTTALAGVFCSYFSHKRNRKAHVIVGCIGFLVSGPGWILVALSLSTPLGMLSYIIGALGFVILLIVVSAILRTRNLPASYELFFFLGIFITNILITFALQ